MRGWHKIRKADIDKKCRWVNKPFDILFDFALAHSELVIPLKATAQLHHSDPYYRVDNFHLGGVAPRKDEISIIPAQEIKRITRNGKPIWVHKDSGRESVLSLAIGKAIDGSNAPQS